MPALAPEVDAASICELVIEPGPVPDIVIEVSDETFGRRINVLVDDNLYTDKDPEVAFWIAMSPDESVGDRPGRAASGPTVHHSELVPGGNRRVR